MFKFFKGGEFVSGEWVLYLFLLVSSEKNLYLNRIICGRYVSFIIKWWISDFLVVGLVIYLWKKMFFYVKIREFFLLNF